MKRKTGKSGWLIFLFLVLFGLPGRAVYSQAVPDSLFMISLRKELGNSKKLCAEPWVSYVGISGSNLTDPPENLPDSVLFRAVKGKNTLVIIHGMGISYSKVKKHYDRVLHWTQEEDDPIPYDIVIGVTWPGLELKPSKLSFGVVFLESNPKARRSGKKLAALLDTLSQTAASMDILTHSMGSKVLLEAMKEKRFSVDRLFLMAPSIDAKVFQENRKYGFVSGAVRDEVVVLYSRNDPAFRFFGEKKMGYLGAVSKKPFPEGKFLNWDLSAEVRSHSYWYYETVYVRLAAFLEGKTIHPD